MARANGMNGKMERQWEKLPAPAASNLFVQVVQTSFVPEQSRPAPAAYGMKKRKRDRRIGRSLLLGFLISSRSPYDLLQPVIIIEFILGQAVKFQQVPDAPFRVLRVIGVVDVIHLRVGKQSHNKFCGLFPRI